MLPAPPDMTPDADLAMLIEAAVRAAETLRMVGLPDEDLETALAPYNG